MGEQVRQPLFTRDDSGRRQSSTLRQVLATVLALVVFGVLLPFAAPGLTAANAAAVADPTALDEVRLATVTDLVAAFEAYGRIDGDYAMTGGSGDRGWGSVYANSSRHSSYGLRSVTETLNDAGVAVATTPTAPLVSVWEIAARPCKDRIAIFSGSDGLVTDAADAQWWDDNDCPVWYLENGRPYFQLTEEPSGLTALDAVRLKTVTELIAGFEHFRVVQGSFPSHGGYDNLGRGSVYVNNSSPNGGNYGVGSIVQVLNTVDADVAFSPRTPLRLWEITAMPCNGRVAIFSGADNLVADPADAQWWDDNNCNSWYIDYGNRPYFQLTAVPMPRTPHVDYSDPDVVKIEVPGSNANIEQYQLRDFNYFEVDEKPNDSNNPTTVVLEIDRETLDYDVKYTFNVVAVIGEAQSAPRAVRVFIPDPTAPDGPSATDSMVAGHVAVRVLRSPTGLPSGEGYKLYNELGFEVDSRLEEEGSAQFFVDSESVALGAELTYTVRSFDGDLRSKAEEVTFKTPDVRPGPRVQAGAGVLTCAGRPVTVQLSLGQQPTAGNDVILGTAGDDVIDGLGGDDLVCGLGGNDVLSGGAGNDELWGGDGVDELLGGADDDYLHGENNDDTLSGNAGNDTLHGGAGVDTLHGNDGNDKLYGHDGADEMYGGAGDDFVRGGAGADVMFGSAYKLRSAGDCWIDTDQGADTMVGDDGDDRIWGGPGDDLLHGNAGRDWLGGGPGADTLRGHEDVDQLGGGVEDYFCERGVLKGRADRFNQDDMDPGLGGPVVGGAPPVPNGFGGSRPANPDEIFQFFTDAELWQMAEDREERGLQGVFIDCWGLQ